MTEISVSRAVERRLKHRPGRLFTYRDFDDLPASAVAPALSRLAARGVIKRARKGVYYVPRRTALGEVPPDPVLLGETVSRGRSSLSGLSAALALGLTTHVPAHVELAVDGMRPSPLRGVIFRPRTGTNRGGLHPDEAALLEVLRDITRLTDLPAAETADKLRLLLNGAAARKRILRAAIDEPPRVRAMVGALAAVAGAPEPELRRLGKTLNPTTRFDFGPLSVLATAKSWRAR